MILSYEQVLDCEKFIQNHEKELSRFEFKVGTSACLQAQYYYLDGENDKGFDIGFYCSLISQVVWSFVEPDPNSDWYLHPADFPAFYERQLFN